MADKLDISQLQKRLKDPQLDAGERQIFADALQDKAKDKARYAGIAAAGGGLFETQGYAGGGILAFNGDEESLVPSPEESVGKTSGPGYGRTVSSFGDILGMLGTEHEWQKADRLKRHGVEYNPPAGYDKRGVPVKKETAAKETAKEEEKAKAPSAGPSSGAAPSQAYGAPTGGGVGTGPDSTLGGILANIRKEGPQGKLGEDFLNTLDERLAGADKRLSRADKLAQAKAWSEFGSTAAPGGMGQVALKSLGTYAEGYGKALESDEKFRSDVAKQKQDILALRRAEERGDVKLATELQDKIADRDNRIKTAQIQAAATMAGHGASQKADAAKIERLMKENGMSYKDALQFVAGAGKMESNDINAIKSSIEVLQNSLLSPGMSKEDRARVQQQIAGLNQQLMSIGSKGGQGGPQVGANPDAGGIVDVPGKGKFQQLPNGNYIKVG
jgi:hypothetical protein